MERGVQRPSSRLELYRGEDIPSVSHLHLFTWRCHRPSSSSWTHEHGWKFSLYSHPENDNIETCDSIRRSTRMSGTALYNNQNDCEAVVRVGEKLLDWKEEKDEDVQERDEEFQGRETYLKKHQIQLQYHHHHHHHYYCHYVVIIVIIITSMIITIILLTIIINIIYCYNCYFT